MILDIIIFYHLTVVLSLLLPKCGVKAVIEFTHQEDNVSVIVSGCQVKSRVITHVGCINTNTAAHQHLNDVVPPHHRSPMQQTKSMFISTADHHITVSHLHAVYKLAITSQLSHMIQLC